MKSSSKRPKLTERDVYDSYALMYIYSITDDPAIKFECVWHCEPIRNKFLWELENICLRELRHVGEECETYKEIENENEDIYDDLIDEVVPLWVNSNFKKFRKEIKRIYEYLKYYYGWELDKNEDIDDCYNTNWLNLTRFQEKCKTKIDLQQISHIFSLWKWDCDYAGKGWAKIAEVTHILRNASPSTFFEVFDRTVDFVHNTGKVISKLNKTRHFKKALNFKANCPTVKSLLPLCSYEVQRIYAKAMGNSLFWLHEYNVGGLEFIPKATRKKKLKEIVTIEKNRTNKRNEWLNHSII